ncbi:MAG: hypothetical protein QXP70_05200 [Methanomassiliicoccales archaeon]
MEQMRILSIFPILLVLFSLFPLAHGTAQPAVPAGYFSAADNVQSLLLSTASPVFTSGNANTTLSFYNITGFEPNSLIYSNSVSVQEFGGTVIQTKNLQYSVAGSGSLRQINLTLPSNLIQGPFNLTFQEANYTAILPLAGICSEPSSSPTVHLLPSANATIIAVGSGFAPYLSLGTPVMGNMSLGFNVTTDSLGAFFFSIQSNLAGGSYTLWFTGNPSQSTNITVTPSVSLFPDSGRPGMHVLVSLSGFPAEGGVSLYWSKSNRGAESVRTNGNGGAISLLNVPPMPHGFQTLYASSGKETAFAVFDLSGQSLAVPEAGVQPGQNITIQAQGFVPGNNVRLIYSGNTLSSSAALSNGTATFSFNVPLETAGSYAIAAVSSPNLSASSRLLVRPIISPNTEMVYAMKQLTVSGSYFYPSTNVTIYIAGRGIITLLTSPSGSFSANITVPVMPQGLHMLYAVDDQLNNATPVPLFIEPSLLVHSTQVPAGGTVSSVWLGLLPNVKYEITINGRPVYSFNSSAEGELAINFSTGDLKPGLYLIGLNGTSALAFELEIQPTRENFVPYLLGAPLAVCAAGVILLFRKYRIR